VKDLAGLVEALLHLHQVAEGGSYNGLGHPILKGCAGCGPAGNDWPCPTVRLIAEVTGSPVPEPVMTEGLADFHPSWCHICTPETGSAP
jgi:hypothetical protein